MFPLKATLDDVLSQAIYDRQTRVGEYLGIDIYGVRTPTANKYIEPFKTAVKNKDGSVHILLTHNYNGNAFYHLGQCVF